jgi:lysozyme family protein
MNNEDEEFNRIEREADMRRKAVSAALNDHVMHMRANLSEYERGVIDGRQMQVQSSVDKAVNALSQRQWIGLTDEEIVAAIHEAEGFNYGLDNGNVSDKAVIEYVRIVEAKLKEKNEM